MLRSCPSCGQANRVPAARLGDRARCGSCHAALLPIAEPVAVSSAAELDELVSASPLPVLVDFWAPWCGPCRSVAPELAKLAKQREGKLVVAKLNTEELPAVAQRFRISGIPTFVLFEQGREARRTSGAMPASELARTMQL